MQENNIKEDYFFGVTPEEQAQPLCNWLSLVQLLYTLLFLV